MNFESPYAFLLLLVIPAMLWLGRRTKHGATVRFSSTGNVCQAGRSVRQRMAGMPTLLRVIALVCLVVALARPQKGLERVRDINKGIAIEMVVDRSGSMSAEMEYKDERMNRLEVVKRVFQDFVLGNKRDLDGRPNDLVGMIAFARYPDTVCPLTLAHGTIPPFLESVHLVQRRAEDGTAIGDALALAAARLKTAEDTLARQLKDEKKTGKYEIKSKIIILLTDGANNCGQRDPRLAAELAAKWGIKIYTIGVGAGDSVMTVRGLFGTHRVPMGQTVDEGPLKAIAKATGGIYRRANTAKALLAVYEEIDELETSEIESIRYMDYREEFLLFALVAFIAILLEIALRCTVFRKLP